MAIEAITIRANLIDSTNTSFALCLLGLFLSVARHEINMNITINGDIIDIAPAKNMVMRLPLEVQLVVARPLPRTV